MLPCAVLPGIFDSSYPACTSSEMYAMRKLRSTLSTIASQLVLPRRDARSDNAESRRFLRKSRNVLARAALSLCATGGSNAALPMLLEASRWWRLPDTATSMLPASNAASLAPTVLSSVSKSCTTVPDSACVPACSTFSSIVTSLDRDDFTLLPTIVPTAVTTPVSVRALAEKVIDFRWLGGMASLMETTSKTSGSYSTSNLYTPSTLPPVFAQASTVTVDPIDAAARGVPDDLPRSMSPASTGCKLQLTLTTPPVGTAVPCSPQTAVLRSIGVGWLSKSVTLAAAESTVILASLALLNVTSPGSLVEPSV